jgi:hypothetical protein
LAAAAVAGCALLIAGPTAAGAHGPSWPYHYLGPTYCEQGQVRIYPPSQMRSALDIPGGVFPPSFEWVWWSPDLLRYNRRRHRWRVVKSGKWYYARANNEGLLQNTDGTVWNLNNSTPIAWVPVNIRRHGRYRVRHWMMWDGLNDSHRQRGPVVCRY